jgi:hypothetical protein
MMEKWLMSPKIRLFGPLLLLAALAGCKLIDQTTFNPALAKKPVAAAPMPALNQDGALLTISLAKGEPDYHGQLASAVKQAQAIKPDIQFNVVSLVPQTASTPPTWDEAQKVTQWARRVADQLQQDGVNPGQIALGLRAVPGLDHGEIRVYVQ